MLTSIFLGTFYTWPLTANAALLTPDREIVTIEFRYHAPEVNVVFLVWGIDGWQSVPEELWLEGTYQDNVMVTPMWREDKSFVAQVRVPAGANMQYGFNIKETAAGKEVNVWDRGKDALYGNLRTQPVVIASEDKVVYVESAVDPNPVFTRQTILYDNPEASEVVLIWGVDGWQVVLEAAWEDSTSIEDNLMHTLMTKKGDRFEAVVLVPEGSTMEYGFAGVKKTGSDVESGFWDGREDYTLNADSNRTTVIDPENSNPTPQSRLSEEPDPPQSFLAKNWPLLAVGVLIALGLIIGFRKSES
jgi:hypothetical protein